MSRPMSKRKIPLLHEDRCFDVPRSLGRRITARNLRGTMSSDLLYHLCDLIFRHDQEHFFVDRSYRVLAEELKKNVSTIARAAKKLRDLGEVEVEPLPDGSYRWYVLLEPDDIESDPDGFFRFKAEYRDAPG